MSCYERWMFLEEGKHNRFYGISLRDPKPAISYSPKAVNTPTPRARSKQQPRKRVAKKESKCPVRRKAKVEPQSDESESDDATEDINETDESESDIEEKQEPPSLKRKEIPSNEYLHDDQLAIDEERELIRNHFERRREIEDQEFEAERNFLKSRRIENRERNFQR